MIEKSIPGPAVPIPSLSYALFQCNPFREPPFDVELGFSDKSMKHLTDCAHIPDAIEKLENFCKKAKLHSDEEIERESIIKIRTSLFSASVVEHQL